jgi:hypothetical protein
MDEWVDGWMHDCMDALMLDGWVNGRMSTWVMLDA